MSNAKENFGAVLAQCQCGRCVRLSAGWHSLTCLWMAQEEALRVQVISSQSEASRTKPANQKLPSVLGFFKSPIKHSWHDEQEKLWTFTANTIKLSTGHHPVLLIKWHLMQGAPGLWKRLLICLVVTAFEQIIAKPINTKQLRNEMNHQNKSVRDDCN